MQKTRIARERHQTTREGREARRRRRRGEAETRRAGATAASRQDEGESGDGGDADRGEAGDGEERAVGCSVSCLSCRSGEKKSAESAATVKLKEEELARGSVEGVDGDGEVGR